MKVSSNDGFIKTMYVKTTVPLPAFTSQQWLLLLHDCTSLQYWTLLDPVQTQHVPKGGQQFPDWMKYKYNTFHLPHRMAKCYNLQWSSLKGACGCQLLLQSGLSWRQEEAGLCNARMQVWVMGLRSSISQGQNPQDPSKVCQAQALENTDGIYRTGQGSGH